MICLCVVAVVDVDVIVVVAEVYEEDREQSMVPWARRRLKTLWLLQQNA